MRVMHYLNPFSNKFHACREFSKLGAGKKALTIITVALAALFTFGVGSVAVFRALVNTFSKLDTKGTKPHEKTAKNTDAASQKKLGTPPPQSSGSAKPAAVSSPAPFDAKEYIVSLGRKAKGSLGERSLRMRAYMTDVMSAAHKKLLETKDDGDCMFDAIAQKLSILEGKPISVKDVRMACYNYIQKLEAAEGDDNWVKTSIGQHSFYDYETFKNAIRYTTQDVLEAGLGAPLWGDALCAQILSAALDVKVISHSLHIYEIDSRSEDYKMQLAALKAQGRIVGVYPKLVNLDSLDNLDSDSSSHSAQSSDESSAESVDDSAKEEESCESTEDSEYLETGYYDEFIQDLDDEEYEAAFNFPTVTAEIEVAEVMTILDLEHGVVFDKRKVKADDGRTIEIASYQSGTSCHVLAVVDSDF